MNQQIAFLGLGLMGGPMSANLATKGNTVKAWNRTPNAPGIAIAQAAGAIIAPSIQEAVTSAKIIFTCVGDVPDVEEVLLGAEGVAKYAPAGALVVDMSTIGRNAACNIATQLKEYQLRFLDAPISGGDIGARKGTLTIMVGGEESDFQECLPLFEAMGKTIRLCGGVGSGQAVKLCNQILCSVYAVALCEALKMANLQEIDPNLIVEVCGTGAAGSWALSNLGPKIIESDYNPGFAIKHILKDLRLVFEEVGNREEFPGTELADRLFKVVRDLDNGEGKELGTQGMMKAYNS